MKMKNIKQIYNDQSIRINSVDDNIVFIYIICENKLKIFIFLIKLKIFIKYQEVKYGA
jgi:c-di-GMP-related signal transduction protein